MIRRISIKKRYPNQDIRYSNFLVSLLINRILKKGKKSLAKILVYKAFDIIYKKLEKDPLIIFERAIKNKKIRSLVPTLISRYNATNIAIKWIISFAKKRTGKEFSLKLANEILDAASKSGSSFKKKEETHKTAEANKSALRSKKVKRKKKTKQNKLKKINKMIFFR
ncbi:hypothetical protein Lal_00048599 [Lupinus albus]|nr:hypothetical protein Lal_00048599 [Lupinus albus]